MRALFNEEARVLVESGTLNTTLMKEDTIWKRIQKLPLGIHVADADAGSVIDDNLLGAFDRALEELEAPIIAGDLPNQLIGPYMILIWDFSEEKDEQTKLFEKDPLSIEGVNIPKISIARPGNHPGSYGISTTLWIPWYGEKLAGKLSTYARAKFWISLINQQLSMDLTE